MITKPNTLYFQDNEEECFIGFARLLTKLTIPFFYELIFFPFANEEIFTTLSFVSNSILLSISTKKTDVNILNTLSVSYTTKKQY